MTQGLVTLRSNHSPSTTLDNLSLAVAARGMMVFARVDFAADAHAAGLDLSQTGLLIFGNPSAGTLLLRERPEAGIDLPLKALAWTDGSYNWLAYNEPSYIATRHQLSAQEVLDKMAAALSSAAAEAIGA